MWKVFRRWGRVLDVFISRKLNSRNRKFGLVRFQGVEDMYALEKKLDVIWIGTWKLRANLPKYSRFKRVSKKLGEQPHSTGRLREQVQQKKRIMQTGTVQRKGEQAQQQLTFAEVVLQSRSSSKGI